MPVLTPAKRLAVLLSLLLLVAAASARADGPPAGEGGQPAPVPGGQAQTVTAPTATVSAPTPPPTPTPTPTPTLTLTPTPTPTPTPTTVPAPTQTVPLPPAPAQTVTPDPAPAVSPPVPPVQTPAPVAAPAASNTTTQTITQVQVSPCASHCDGGTQVQQAAQDNTTVQATPPGPAPTSTAAAQPPTRSSAPKQVQVGCLEECHGTTTLDTSGMTLGQIEHLLGQLELPPLPPVTPVPGALQNVTQQTSAQSQQGAGASANQSQVAVQSNTTVQVADGPSEASTGPALVNQTGQLIWQVQVGCLFDCTGTQQLQQATQTNTTVQAPAGGSALDAVTQLIWQLQIGCLFSCYDAVESQGASATDSTTVVSPAPPEEPVAQPVGAAPPPTAGDAPAPVLPAAPPKAPPDDPAALPVPTGSAPAGGDRTPIIGAGLVMVMPGRIRATFEAVGVSAGSTSVTAGPPAAAAAAGQALLSISASRSVAVAYSRPHARPARDHERRRPAGRRTAEPQRVTQSAARAGGVEPSGGAEPWLMLAVAAAAALALGTLVRQRARR